MHPMGEILATNRFMAQPRLDIGWAVIDRVNGETVATFDTVDAASDDAKTRNAVPA